MSDWKEREIGGLWEKKSGSGKDYLSGTVTINGEVVPFQAWPNTFKKEGENTPDFRLYRQDETTNSAPANNAPAKPAPDTASEDIPF